MQSYQNKVVFPEKIFYSEVFKLKYNVKIQIHSHTNHTLNARYLPVVTGYHVACLCVQVHSVISGSHGLQPTRLPCLWDFSGKNHEVGYHFLLQPLWTVHVQNASILLDSSAGDLLLADKTSLIIKGPVLGLSVFSAFRSQLHVFSAFRSQLHHLMDFNISSLSLFSCRMEEGINDTISQVYSCNNILKTETST